MAISVNVPLATNQIISDYAAINANWEYVILSDGTAGQVLRYSRLVVAYNATASSVQVYLESRWNGDAIDTSGAPHVITIADDDTNWALASGLQLTIKAAGFTGNPVVAFTHVTYNKTGESNIIAYPAVTANDMYLTFYKGSAGSTYDISGLVSGESFNVDILYLTSA